jgi:Tfp pilus assembly protein PilV
MPPDLFIAAIVIGVAVVALAGVLLYHNRARRDGAQARKQLAQAQQAQEQLSREAAAKEQRLQKAEHQVREATEQVREAAAKEQRLQKAERQVREATEQVREACAQQDLVRAETEYLLSTRIPALVSYLRAPHVIVPGLQNPGLTGTDVDRLHRGILDAVARAVREEAQRIDEAAQAIIRGAMSRVQTQGLRAQDLLAGVQQRYSGDEHTGLLREVLGLDMFNELIVRRAQATGIACGATTGLSRDDTYLADLMVGAISRVENFEQRIEVPANHLRRRVGVAARAAEPILFITSELLANAVHHSHGTLKVTIALHETNTGAAIVIDDAGVGLNEEQYARATRLLSGNQPVRLVDLGNPPRTGWAAIGRQVAHYGMQVTVKKSAFGGVQAVISVPTGLLVEMPETSQPSVLAPEPVRPVQSTPIQREPARTIAGLPQREPAETPPGLPQRQPAETFAGLPERRRRSPSAAAPHTPGGNALTTPEEAQRRWGDFQTGAEAGRREAMPSQPHDSTEGN